MTPEDKALRRRCAAMSNFKGIVKNSKILTYQQKPTLIGQAKNGDLDGAWNGYRKLVGDKKEGA